MLRELVDLARERSADKRRDVMHALSQLFVEGIDHHNDRELVLFGDVLCRLLDQVAPPDRTLLAKRVARFAQTPRDLVLKLAHDAAQVATPILTISPVLTEADLVEVVTTLSEDHVLAVCRRIQLAETLTDLIIARALDPTLAVLARNLGAHISQPGFEALAGKALTVPTIGEALSNRVDLPTKVARDILPTLPPTARMRIEQMLRFDSEHSRGLVGSALQSLEASRNNQRRHRAEVKSLINEVRTRKRSVNAALDALIEQKRTVDIAAFLADLADLQESHVSNVLHKVGGTGIAMVCRKLGISNESYERLSVLRCEKLRLPATQAKPMLDEYQAIDEASAEKGLRPHAYKSGRDAYDRA